MADQDDVPAERTSEDLEARHERERADLEEKCRAHVDGFKNLGRGKKAIAVAGRAEREAEQWRYDLHQRHEAELDWLAEHLGTVDEELAQDKVNEPSAAAPEPVLEQDRIQRKREKAQKKKQGRASKAAEREAEREREQQEAGPSRRELENVALATQLAKLEPPQQVHEVSADGNCLYRAVGHQLQLVRSGVQSGTGPSGSSDYQKIRSICAEALRKRPDTYSCFTELADGESYDGYCNRVESSSDWGGELELRALADELQVQILVHRAEAEPLPLGDSDCGLPLQVTYHRHYFTLGEHYNSVVPRCCS